MEVFFLSLPPFSSATQKIRACDSGKEDLLGSAPCVWGPQYWCKNMATAVECSVSAGAVPSPWPVGAGRPCIPSCPVPPAGCRTLPAPRVELGAVSSAGWTCSAVWLGILAPSPWDVPALTDGNGRSQPASSRQRGCGEPQWPLPFPLPLLGLGFPNQVKELVNIFRTRDSALTSLRATAKSPTSIPNSISIPNPFSTSPSHPEPLIRPRSCNVDLSPWAGLGSAAQMPAPRSWLAAASPEHKMNEFGCKDFLSQPHPCQGSCADLAVVVRAVRCWLVPPCHVRGMPTVPGPEHEWEHPITNKLFL